MLVRSLCALCAVVQGVPSGLYGTFAVEVQKTHRGDTLQHNAACSSNTSDAQGAFKRFYKRLYMLRVSNQTADGASPHLDNAAESDASTNRPLCKESQQASSLGTFDWSHTTEMLDRFYEHYEELIADGKLARVVVEGNSEEILDAEANYLWEKTGGKFVEQVLTDLGDIGGLEAGEFVGGAIGGVIGVFQPELGVPLVTAGVFLGGKLGEFLGHFGGKLAAGVANEFLEEKVIDQALNKALEKHLLGAITGASSDPAVTGDRGLCSAGYYDRVTNSSAGNRRPNCYECDGWMEYSDTSGMVNSCKTCSEGSCAGPHPAPHKYCYKCPVGTAWTATGVSGHAGCEDCDGWMHYSDSEGLTACQKCSPGSVAGPHPGPHKYCYKCPVGTAWTETGVSGHAGCADCDGWMHYSDEEGLTECKKCPPGSAAGPHPGPHRYCYKCPVGTAWTETGVSGHAGCADCDGWMSYSDAEGSTECKRCAPGSVALPHPAPHKYCGACDPGTYWTADGVGGHAGCLWCPRNSISGAGATSCTPCPAGQQASTDHTTCRANAGIEADAGVEVEAAAAREDAAGAKDPKALSVYI